MRITIDIPEETYDKIREYDGRFEPIVNRDALYRAIKCGSKANGRVLSAKDTEGFVRSVAKGEIAKLAAFHSVKVPIQYGDGTAAVDRMVSLEELGAILSEALEPDSSEAYEMQG